RFKRNMERWMETLVHKDLKFKWALSDDGSGKGAALVACVAEQNSSEIPVKNDKTTN
ncbi:unnamed protein product, partial [Rotaria sp. Silwood1]